MNDEPYIHKLTIVGRAGTRDFARVLPLPETVTAEDFPHAEINKERNTLTQLTIDSRAFVDGRWRDLYIAVSEETRDWLVKIGVLTQDQFEPCTEPALIGFWRTIRGHGLILDRLPAKQMATAE